jgi:hypothetical protein
MRDTCGEAPAIVESFALPSTLTLAVRPEAAWPSLIMAQKQPTLDQPPPRSVAICWQCCICVTGPDRCAGDRKPLSTEFRAGRCGHGEPRGSPENLCFPESFQSRTLVPRRTEARGWMIFGDCNKRITLLSFAESIDPLTNHGLGWESGAQETNSTNLQMYLLDQRAVRGDLLCIRRESVLNMCREIESQ